MHATKFLMSGFASVAACGFLLLVQYGALAAAIDSARLPPPATRAVDFEKDIQPIFAKHCYSCHGPDKQKGEFRLDVKEKALAGGDSGPAIVSGKSANSPLIHFVAGIVEDKVMPQKGDRLTIEQVGLLRAWIDQGAKWPDHLAGARHATNYWAFKQIVRPPLPIITRYESRITAPIDRFIIAKLEERGLALAPPADKATLMRRATFDLLGLPPTPAALATFLADDSTNAFEKVVDRLLASPRYGERWARHWLDLARFSESDGFEFDKMREHAWRYRDYVVGSFNDDKPYAQFIREQIAGDALEPATRDGIVATGFLTAGPFDEAGNTSASALLKARIREEEMEDMIAGVSQTFLAMTVNCARCHDHKFDPIPQRDYYRMKAALDGVRHGNRPLLTSAEIKAREERVGKLNGRIGELEKGIAAIDQSTREKIIRERASNEAVRSRDQVTNLVAPIARWTFEGDAKDSVGNLHGALLGGAKITRGRLVLDGKGAFARTPPLSRTLREKTLEAWIALPNLTQGGGGVISLETKESGTFDAIVFGERAPKKWMAGSSYFQRSRDLTAPDEDAKPGELIHVAVVYRADNSITVYRNGMPYGETYTPSGVNAALQIYAIGEARLLFGLRHTGAGNGFLAAEIEEARLYDRPLSAAEILASARSMGTTIITPEELVKSMTDEQRHQRVVLKAEEAKLRDTLKALPPVEQVYAAVSRQPEPTFILARGDVEKKKGQATPGGLSAVAGTSDFGLTADEPEARRRQKLAEWITSPDNPLTWRVMVNRVWHYHFGRGLVATPNDFGVNGEQPSHPELLDWLASEFLAQGGSLKKLHRAIMLSATYQQSSVGTGSTSSRDADNRLLSHFPLRRLEAEAVRDAMLSVSAQLNPQMGGPGFRPFKVTVSGSHFYEITDPIGPEFNRRTLYRMNIQSGKDPLLDSLDCPDPSTKTPARSVTTTPIQSLGLMNNAFVQRQCRSFAERLKKEAGENSAAQIRLAYLLAFGREPRADETKQSVVLARAHGLESVCWVLLNASEFLYVR
jgi:mono/diheme cytochrome c family protein